MSPGEKGGWGEGGENKGRHMEALGKKKREEGKEINGEEMGCREEKKGEEERR